jgi:hypothetical protein
MARAVTIMKEMKRRSIIFCFCEEEERRVNGHERMDSKHASLFHYDYY